jgi:aspartyl-tRNA(Asn)/glutamyl-tRNA(Gln) amidotransferase subunit B
LPVLNRAAVELSARAAFALGVKPERFSRFERKHYFYPDLPKGYQITQLEEPIIKGGQVEINTSSRIKKINIERANLEEDAGKNIHPADADYSLVDLNRAGTPLLEIVSAPDLSSASEAKAFARELWLLMRYADVTDGDLYHGHVRFDVNVSLGRNGQKGTRSEVKNLNSFRSVENAVAYEIKRQTDLLDKGHPVAQETRGWDEAKQKSVSQRGKEEAEDYRFMPEPDIPPLELEAELLDKIKLQMPQLPKAIRQQLNELRLESEVIENILDSPITYGRVSRAIEKSADPAAIRRMAFDSLESAHSHNITIDDHLEIIKLQQSGHLSSSAAKQLIKSKSENLHKPVHELASELNLHQVSDKSAIEKLVSEVLKANPKAADELKAGQERALGFLVGQVMAKSQGRANPGLTKDIIKKQLGVS